MRLLIGLTTAVAFTACTPKKRPVELDDENPAVASISRSTQPIVALPPFASDDEFDFRYIIETVYDGAPTGLIQPLPGGASAGNQGALVVDASRGLLWMLIPSLQRGRRYEMRTYDVSGAEPVLLGVSDLMPLTNTLGDSMITRDLINYAPPEDPWFYCNLPPVRVEDGGGAYHYEGYRLVWGEDTAPLGCRSPLEPAGSLDHGTCSGAECVSATQPERFEVRDLAYVNGKLVLRTHHALNFFDLENPTQPRFMFAKRIPRVGYSLFQDYGFCSKVLDDGREAYFITRGPRTFFKDELGNPTTIDRMGGVDVFIYDQDETTAAATMSSENQRSERIDRTLPLLRSETWDQRLPAYDYHIENVSFSPTACAVYADGLFGFDTRAGEAVGWQNKGSYKDQYAVDLSQMDGWPQWTSADYEAIEAESRPGTEMPSLPSADVFHKQVFELIGPKEMLVTAVNAEGLAVVGHELLLGMFLVRLTPDLQMHYLAFIGPFDGVSFSDTARWPEPPVISHLEPNPINTHKATFLGNKTIVLLGLAIPSVTVYDVSDPTNPLQLFREELTQFDVLVDVKADALHQHFFVTAANFIRDTPIYDRFLRLGSPEATYNYDPEDIMGDYAEVISETQLLTYDWEWAR